jgi:hypothetical protein
MDTLQSGMQSCIAESPPALGARLRAWTIVAEWETADGERILSRMSSPETPVWEYRGYLHEALYGVWAGTLDGWDGNGE